MGFISEKINYVSVNPDKRDTIFFLHGNSHSLQNLKGSVYSDLFPEFHLVFLDLPGHGASDSLSEYTLPVVARYIANFINRFSVGKRIVVGHSFGGHVALHLLDFITIDGLFIFGTPPLKKPFDQRAFNSNENSSVFFSKNPNPAQVENLMRDLGYPDYYIPEAIRFFNKTDPDFRSQIYNSLETGRYLDEAELLKNSKSKICFLVSSRDPFINSFYTEDIIRDAGVDLIKVNSGHCPHVTHQDYFNFHLLDFVTQLTLPENE